MLDNLPPWARHLAILFGAAFLFTVGTAVITAGGGTGLDWVATGKAALDSGLCAVAASVLLVVTPLTKQYGVGK